MTWLYHHGLQLTYLYPCIKYKSTASLYVYTYYHFCYLLQMGTVSGEIFMESVTDQVLWVQNVEMTLNEAKFLHGTAFECKKSILFHIALHNTCLSRYITAMPPPFSLLSRNVKWRKWWDDDVYGDYRITMKMRHKLCSYRLHLFLVAVMKMLRCVIAISGIFIICHLYNFDCIVRKTFPKIVAYMKDFDRQERTEFKINKIITYSLPSNTKSMFKNF